MAFNASVDHTIMVHVSKYSPEIEDQVASAAITPGMLLEWDSNGDLLPHQDKDAFAQTIFAVEDDRATMDTAYEASERVIAYNMRRGDVIWAWLKAGETVGIGYPLSSAGGGLLGSPTVPTPGSYVGVSKESLIAPGTNTRIKIEVM